MSKPTRYMTTASDPGGMPRAWGVGPTREASREECQRQLEAYCSDPVREFTDPKAFTLATSPLAPEP